MGMGAGGGGATRTNVREGDVISGNTSAARPTSTTARTTAACSTALVADADHARGVAVVAGRDE